MNPSRSGPAPIDFFAPLFDHFRSALHVALARFLAAPLRNSAIGLVSISIAWSASNALFWQSRAHPSPFFASPTRGLVVEHANATSTPIIAPQPLERAVRQAAQRHVAPVQPAPAPLPPAAPSAQQGQVTNQMLADAQRALTRMGLYDGKIDGYYGPQTAAAIRAFETRVGLPAKGALAYGVISMINSSATPVFSAPADAAPQASVQAPEMPVAVAPQNDPLQRIADSVANEPSPQAVASASPAATDPVTDRKLVEQIQRGLASLGFYNQAIDGIAGESTARAIREFENFKSYRLTGQVSPELLVWLRESGAQI